MPKRREMTNISGKDRDSYSTQSDEEIFESQKRKKQKKEKLEKTSSSSPLPAESVEENMHWLVNVSHEEPFMDDEWDLLGEKEFRMDKETEFCHPGILSNLINLKAAFNKSHRDEMCDARTRSNPFETIRSASFINHAAVKMANIDKACDFMFTKPKNLKKDELLYFADVCAGPGGFSEYVLFRKQWKAKGFGFTLKGKNDFKLDNFTIGTPETFHPYYGPREDGDVFCPENQLAFRDLIMKQTKSKGVHFMMADGGFSVEGQENIQEILSKQLYLCQCLVALMIVRTGGNFVTKLFDIFTPFSAGLVYLMYRCFDEISIFKPNSSRPANSERYLICKGKRPNTQMVEQHLFRVNENYLNVLVEGEKTITRLVPLEWCQRDEYFFAYLKKSNNDLACKQVNGLLKIAHYTQEKHLVDERQASVRQLSLEHWELPDRNQNIPKKTSPEEKIESMLRSSINLLKQDFSAAKGFFPENINNTVLNSPLDWYCMPCASEKGANDERNATFYLGLGRAQVFRYVKNTWQLVKHIILPADTLVYAEMVTEVQKAGKHQRRAERLHIIDAYFLGGEFVSKKYLLDRHRILKTFCEALWNPNGQECKLFVKDLLSVDEYLDKRVRLEKCQMKNGDLADVYFPRRNLMDYNCEEDVSERWCYKPKSFVFVKATADNWARHRSTKTASVYFYNISNKKSFYENDRPPNAGANFKETIKNMIVWEWLKNNNVTMDSVMKHIRHALVKKSFST